MMQCIKEKLRRRLSQKQFILLKRFYLLILSIPFGFSLNMLAKIYKSDKYGKHNYTKHYTRYFRKLKFKNLKILEIGVGGYHLQQAGGNSLRMWKRYFPFSRIYSLDIYDKTQFEEPRIKIFKGDQTDLSILDRICSAAGEFDIIIDDGSHINDHVLTSFKFLFQKLKTGGIYVIEDTGTSYWPDYGGDSENLNNPGTIINFFKTFIDGLNYRERITSDYTPTYFDLNVYSIEFFHNLIFVIKGPNNEPSGIDPDNPCNPKADRILL